VQYLTPYSLFESESFELSKAQRFCLNEITAGTWSINEQGLIDVEGYVGLQSKLFMFIGNQKFILPGSERMYDLKFGKVSRDFFLKNLDLVSLQGSPYFVGKTFISDQNKSITSLDFSPLEVGSGFRCISCNLTSLANGPQKVGTDYVVYHNNLTDLQGAPISVPETFNCSYNPLTSLSGAPWEVGSFICEVFRIDDWNPGGWTKMAMTGKKEAKDLLDTLPFLNPSWWVETFKSSKKSRDQYKMVQNFFSSCDAYREFDQIKKEVAKRMSPGFLQNMEDYQDLKSFGL
jgi:hypothetical protein